MRLSEIDQELMEIKETLAEKQRFEHKLEVAQLEWRQLQSQLAEAKKQLDKEQRDVDKLESFSLAGLWFSFIGRKREKLSKETEERDQALYQYKRIEQQMEPLKAEIDDLKAKIDSIWQKTRRKQVLLEEKEALILDGHHESKETLESINNQMIHLERQTKELKEAIQAGNALLNNMKQVHASLNSAKGWGTWDIMGGGFFANMAKHSKLDDAERGIKQLEYLASRFRRELSDVEIDLNISIDIDSTLRFFDYFFDGLFVDITVQNRINRAISQLANEQRKIETIIARLYHDEKRVREDLKKQQELKRQLLIQFD